MIDETLFFLFLSFNYFPLLNGRMDIQRLWLGCHASHLLFFGLYLILAVLPLPLGFLLSSSTSHAWGMYCYRWSLYTASLAYVTILYKKHTPLPPQWWSNQIYMSRIVSDQSLQYLLAALTFAMTSSTYLTFISALALYASLHLSSSVLQQPRLVAKIPPFVQYGCTQIQSHQSMLLVYAAAAEAATLFTVLAYLITGQGSILVVFVYYQFLCYRYAYSSEMQMIASQLRLSMDAAVGRWMPVGVQGVYTRMRDLLMSMVDRNAHVKMAQAIKQQQQQQQAK